MAAAQPMKIRMVAGLGNPGEEYENTRHNAGFKAIDELARQAGDIYVCATHGIFSGEAVKRLNEAPIVECLVTDAIPVEEGGKIKTISVAQEFAEAIAAVYHEEPVSKLIGGDFAL